MANTTVSSERQLKVGIVGLGFGEAFVPIYQRHPNVSEVMLCEPDAGRLQEVGERFAIQHRFSQLEDLLGQKDLDAVHILTPVPVHARQVLAALESGKHCASAVPMATSLEDLSSIVAEQKRTGLNYMMMETAIYSREFFFVQDLIDRGEIGNLTFLRGTYYQDLESDYPKYWRSMPPMHYATHSLSPLLALARSRAVRVCSMGAGHLRDDIQQPGGNTFPMQSALFRLAETDAIIDLTRSWFQTARAYTEAFSVYGDKKGFEWQQLEQEDPVLFTLDPVNPAVRWRDATAERISIPYRPDLLPVELQEFAEGGHGGSHPHLVNEFVTSIVQSRPPRIDALTAANWTAAGICANDSSLLDGAPVAIPAFS